MSADFSNVTAAKADASAAVRLRAPLFASLIERMYAGGRQVILDLGPAQTATVSLFNRFHCRLDIADLAAAFAVLNSLEEPGILLEQVENILPVRGGEATDIVLCWDLLNYLQRPALSAVMNRVAARSRSGTLVHALIVYSARRMPARPDLYKPCDKSGSLNGSADHLAITSMTDEDCDAPQYTPDNLMRCMQGYRIERAVLLSSGMQEYLFRID